MLTISPVTLGIDLGQRAIKGVSLRKIKGKVTLEKIFSHDLTQSSDDFPCLERTYQALEAMVDLNQLEKTNVVSSIYSHQMESFDVLIPEMPQKEIRKALYHEVKNHIRYPIEECAFDFIELGSFAKDSIKSSEKKLKVFYSPSQQMEEKLEKLKNTSLRPIAFDLDAVAIAETLRFNDYLDQNKIYISIDFGESHTTISLLSQQQVIYFNSFTASFGSINHELKNKFDFNYKQSEDIKNRLSTLFNKSNISPEESFTEQLYLNILKNVYETIDYYISQIDGADLSEIFVTGGGSKDLFLLDLIEKKYKTKVSPINPFRNINIFNTKNDLSSQINELSATMALAVGLALWESD